MPRQHYICDMNVPIDGLTNSLRHLEHNTNPSAAWICHMAAQVIEQMGAELDRNSKETVRLQKELIASNREIARLEGRPEDSKE